jgi:hypothetical protein
MLIEKKKLKDFKEGAWQKKIRWTTTNQRIFKTNVLF